MLTVDYGRLGLSPGELLLDLGCGAGRHAFEGLRGGARVVALDASYNEVLSTRNMFRAMGAEREAAEGSVGSAVQGDALRVPFRDGAFDRIIVSEVLEHVKDDTLAIAELSRVLKPQGVLAVTVPRFVPELVNWRLSKEYHDQPGGHIRIYPRTVLVDRLEKGGLKVVASHYAHGLHSPYWWLRSAVGPANDRHPAVAAYHRLLVWDITKRPLVTRLAERALAPLIGKSLVLYARKRDEHG